MRLEFQVRMTGQLADTLNGISNTFRHVAILRIATPNAQDIFIVPNRNDSATNFSLWDTRKLTTN